MGDRKMGSTHQTIEIEAAPDHVWQAIRDFHDMSWAPNVISDMQSVGEKEGSEVGAARVLNGVFHETLRTFEDDAKTLTYSIDDGPSPISKNEVENYVGRVTVRQIEQGESSLVEWSSSWQHNNEAAAEFCQGIYVALLEDMKKSLEQVEE
jgi:carbon monoxide dehydrogenase subunit G